MQNVMYEIDSVMNLSICLFIHQAVKDADTERGLIIGRLLVRVPYTMKKNQNMVLSCHWGGILI